MDKAAQLYRRYLDGEEAAFTEIVSLFRSGLTFFINGYLHDDAATEDIIMDVFLQLVIHKHRYNFKTSLKTYLYAIARSKAIDCLRHSKRLAELPLEEEVCSSCSPEDTVLDSEQIRQLYSEIERLPEQMRCAVYLVYIEGLSYEECAAVMKKSKKQIDNILYRAKKELYTALKED